MKKYYKIFGLDEDASFSDIQKKYKHLLAEFDPKKQSDELKDLFISEQNKLHDAYDKLKSHFESSKLSANETEEEIQKNEELNSSNEKITEEDEPQNESISDTHILNENDKIKKKTPSFATNLLLTIIAIGIWGLFMQNLGFFVAVDDYAQEVRVINTVDTEVKNTVNARVNNLVEVDLTSINGYSNAFYNNSRHKEEYYRIPVYNYGQ